MDIKKLKLPVVLGGLFIVSVFVFTPILRVLATGAGNFYKVTDYPLTSMWGGYTRVSDATLASFDQCPLKEVQVYDKGKNLYRAVVSGLVLDENESSLRMLVREGDQRHRVWKMRKESVTTSVRSGEMDEKCNTVVMDWVPSPPDSKSAKELDLPNKGHLILFRVEQSVFEGLSDGKLSDGKSTVESLQNMIVGSGNVGVRDLEFDELNSSQ